MSILKQWEGGYQAFGLDIWVLAQERWVGLMVTTLLGLCSLPLSVMGSSNILNAKTCTTQ